jgi:hypothetical protein
MADMRYAEQAVGLAVQIPRVGTCTMVGIASQLSRFAIAGCIATFEVATAALRNAVRLLAG